MNRAPRILALARAHGPEWAGSVRKTLARQTFRGMQVVFVRGDDEGAAGDSNAIAEEQIPAFIAASGADFLLFWPDEVTPQEAAAEKLLLGLVTAPDFDGVAEAAQGSNGFWMSRAGGNRNELAALWFSSQMKWSGACVAQPPRFFYLRENLTVNQKEPDRSFAVERFFSKLPYCFANYQEIEEELLWSMPQEPVNERSVLLIVASLPMGGACKFILDVTARLIARDYRVTVATTAYDSEENNPWLNELVRLTPDVFVVPQARPVQLPRLLVHLARTRHCGRVVISHSQLGYQLLPWLRRQLPEVAFADYTHIEYETEWPEGGFALRSVRQQPLLDNAMVSSEHLRDWMIARGAEKERVRVCHTNIDAEKWAPDAEARAHDRYELGLNAKTAVILYPCRLTEQKRPELLCRIIESLRRATKVPFVVLIAGDGPLKRALQNFVARYGLENHCRLLGAVSLQRVARLHNAADIFLLPSQIEGIALALFEAMAMESVPVVADVGGQRELVTPACGTIIPLGDPVREVAQYVEALKVLLENPVRRRAQGIACRNRVRDHFQLDRMVSQFIESLEEAASRHQAHPAPLPPASVCREIATLAIDQVRLGYEGRVVSHLRGLLEERVNQQEIAIAKLRRQMGVRGAARPVPEENELAV